MKASIYDIINEIEDDCVDILLQQKNIDPIIETNIIKSTVKNKLPITTHKKTIFKRTWKFAFVFIVLVTVSTSTIARQKYKWLNGSEIITEKNKDTVGKEIDYDDTDFRPKKLKEMDGFDVPENNIIKKIISAEDPIFDEIDEFILKPKSTDIFYTPSIITTNGAVAIFKADQTNGWNLKKGDKLIFNYSLFDRKLPGNIQSLEIGYIYNNTWLDNGETIKAMDGTYEMEVTENGEYWLYVRNWSSETISLKEGTMQIEQNK